MISAIPGMRWPSSLRSNSPLPVSMTWSWSAPAAMATNSTISLRGMAKTKKFRFGAQIASARSREDWVAKARKAEDLGFSTLFMPDHFGDQLAPVPALMAAADATTTLRIASLVFDNDFRHPLVLAKEGATLDLLSDGRLEFGLGAGWMRTDYEESGIPFDEPAVRVDRLEEALAIVKGLWADKPFSFEGKHYTITEHDGLPKPVQKPHPPILVGGGAKRVLSIAGREADIVSINFNLRPGVVSGDLGPDGTAERVEQKIGWVRDAAGDRFDDIELGVTIFFPVITDDRKATAEALAGGFKLTPEQALEIPFALVGTVDEIVDDLVARRERFGLSYIAISGGGFRALAPVVEKLAGT